MYLSVRIEQCLHMLLINNDSHMNFAFVQVVMRQIDSCLQGPGKCFRLYTEELFEKLHPTTLPEIQRYKYIFTYLSALLDCTHNDKQLF